MRPRRTRLMQLFGSEPHAGTLRPKHLGKKILRQGKSIAPSQIALIRLGAAYLRCRSAAHATGLRGKGVVLPSTNANCGREF